ncbi:MAG TPA: 23S rRNA (pseudouridine(1915)-N(3))-methyltransferase RlmH [Thermoanaerobaculaceae bacterium]|nr:23S rRNA (pseudouridine(1915)-N(3))-methyltransferase RlmH [Thermoanaerobaculaceae bacterium]HPS77066.1 23S rRNA (pseudouridine(1915)-N(3))-methyltransferase RlmH [Thermoanaerobaculaceae bacterium]
MNGLVVLWVGKRAPEAVQSLVEEYRQRVGRFMPCSDVRSRPAEGRGGDRSRVLAQEAERIADHLQPGDLVVALDERGVEQRSEELARWIGEGRQRARLVFVLGSDLGLDPELLARANLRLSLSRLTLPHQMARLVLWEQLFRACDLLAGGGYHRGGEDAREAERAQSVISQGRGREGKSVKV